jgi:hypothetical protein
MKSSCSLAYRLAYFWGNSARFSIYIYHGGLQKYLPDQNRSHRSIILNEGRGLQLACRYCIPVRGSQVAGGHRLGLTDLGRPNLKAPGRAVCLVHVFGLGVFDSMSAYHEATCLAYSLYITGAYRRLHALSEWSHKVILRCQLCLCSYQRRQYMYKDKSVVMCCSIRAS